MLYVLLVAFMMHNIMELSMILTRKKWLQFHLRYDEGLFYHGIILLCNKRD